MIYTVFPKDENEMPMDFPTRQEAKAYIEENNLDATIEATDGDVE